jgi:hypothetical protein
MDNFLKVLIVAALMVFTIFGLLLMRKTEYERYWTKLGFGEVITLAFDFI